MEIDALIIRSPYETTFQVKSSGGLAGPEFELMAKNTPQDMTWLSPARAGGSLLLRGVERLNSIKP